MDKISIIIPLYNVEKYLRKCLNSIINQTYKNIEIILVDDGSTDESPAICDEYAKKDNRIKVIHKANSGVSSARNLGMRESTGDYIVFVDSDDYVSNDFCEVLYKGLKENDCDISCIGYNVVDVYDNITSSSSQITDLEDNEVVVFNDKEIIKELLEQRILKNFSCRLYKKDVLIDYQEGINYEDIVFSVKVFMNCKRLVYTNKCCYNYLVRNNSLTTKRSEKDLLDFFNAIYERYEIIRKNYPEFMLFNIKSLILSTLALSVQNISIERKYDTVNEKIDTLISIVNKYVQFNEKELLYMLNDYQKAAVYLMQYNVELYYNMLEERQNLKESGKI